MEELARMRTEVQGWAKQFAAHLEFVIWHYADSPNVPGWQQNLDNAGKLSDLAYLNSLPHDLLVANHEALQAWVADKKVQDEETEQLVADFEKQIKGSQG